MTNNEIIYSGNNKDKENEENLQNAIKEVLSRDTVKAEVKKNRTPVEIVKDAGNLFITSIIQEINATGNFFLEKSNKYTDFVKTYSKYMGEREVDELSTNYLIISFAITTLYNTHNVAISSFDRQTLKLNTLLTEMYLIERDIEQEQTIAELNRKNQEQFIKLQQDANNTAKEFLDTMAKQKGQMTEEQYQAFNDFLQVNTQAIKLAEEEKKKLQKQKIDHITPKQWREQKHIRKYANAEENTGLVSVIYRSLTTDICTDLILRAIYKYLDIDATLYTQTAFELLSYSIVCDHIKSLLKLAEENKSINDDFKETEAYKQYMSYIHLKEKTESKEMQKFFVEEIERLQDMIDKQLTSVPKKKRQIDTDAFLQNLIITCRQNLIRKLRW